MTREPHSILENPRFGRKERDERDRPPVPFVGRRMTDFIKGPLGPPFPAPTRTLSIEGTLPVKCQCGAEDSLDVNVKLYPAPHGWKTYHPTPLVIENVPCHECGRLQNVEIEPPSPVELWTLSPEFKR